MKRSDGSAERWQCFTLSEKPTPPNKRSTRFISCAIFSVKRIFCSFDQNTLFQLTVFQEKNSINRLLHQTCDMWKQFSGRKDILTSTATDCTSPHHRFPTKCTFITLYLLTEGSCPQKNAFFPNCLPPLTERKRLFWGGLL